MSQEFVSLLGPGVELYKCKAWTGPTQVKEIANRIKEAGLIDVFDGTEHVYWKCSGNNPQHALMRSSEIMRQRLGTDFGLFSRPLPATAELNR